MLASNEVRIAAAHAAYDELVSRPAHCDQCAERLARAGRILSSLPEQRKAS